MLRDAPVWRTSNDDAELFMNASVSNNEQSYHQNDLNDDIFGSAPSSPTHEPQQQHDGEAQPTRHGQEHPSDVARLRSLHLTNGYREGIAISKEQYIQAGFDEGYSLGGELGLEAGWCLGALEGIQRAVQQAPSAAGDEARLAIEHDVLALCEQAEKELTTESIFSAAYFSSEGFSIFGVTLQEGQTEGDVTVSDLAAAHPLIVRWHRAVRDLALRLSLDMRKVE